jgi:hypothetical protein
MSVSLKFHDRLFNGNYVEVSKYSADKIRIITIDETTNESKSIVLDRQTAVKFSKELRKQIALLF